MIDREIAYVAGLLEGEGCFDINRGVSPRIRMETCDEDVALYLQHLIGTGTITRRRGKKAVHRDSFVYQLSKHHEVQEVLRVIYPMMSDRRRLAIDLLLAC
jgi:hypothetical protein